MMCKFLCANLNSAMFSNSVFERLHFWAYLLTNNLEVVSHCNSCCSTTMTKSIHSVKLGLVALQYAAIHQHLLISCLDRTMVVTDCLIPYSAASIAVVGNRKLSTYLRYLASIKLYCSSSL